MTGKRIIMVEGVAAALAASRRVAVAHMHDGKPKVTPGEEYIKECVEDLTEAHMLTPPKRLTTVVSHKDYHPSYMRVGVRINGVERNDIQWYDAERKLYSTVAPERAIREAETIELYWRYPETRQQRRARQRWEKTHAK